MTHLAKPPSLQFFAHVHPPTLITDGIRLDPSRGMFCNRRSHSRLAGRVFDYFYSRFEGVCMRVRCVCAGVLFGALAAVRVFFVCWDMVLLSCMRVCEAERLPLIE